MPMPSNLIQSVERSIKILDVLAQSGNNGLGLGELSKQVGIRPSTAHHLLNTLINYQVTEQDPISKRYRLGIHLIRLGNSALASTTLARIARKPVEHLWKTTGQSCSFLAFNGLVRTQIIGSASQQMLTAKAAPLEISTLHATGSGKLLLAFLPEQELLDYLSRTRLERFTASTITETGKLVEELVQIRIQRYALDKEEYGLGVNCISAAVQDATQSVVGCLDLVFPVYNITPDLILEWIEKTCQDAAALTKQLHDIGLKI
jgi:IclR family acetate operon transcriptional repressor